MIDVSYICDVIFVVMLMGQFKFPKSSQFVFFDAGPFVHHCVFR